MTLSKKHVFVWGLFVSVFLCTQNLIFAQMPTPTPIIRDLVVEVFVPPKVTDYQLEFDTDPSGVVTVGQNEEITFSITYGSHLKYAAPMTIQAEWYLGTLVGEELYTFDVVSYVPGSASAAEGSTVPVINLSNRTITWDITSFPSQTTDKVVTFKLKTPVLRIADSDVEFKVKARLYTPQITLPDEELLLTYIPSGEYYPTATPTFTPTPTAASSPASTTATPTLTIAPTSTPQPQPLISDIALFELYSTSATLLITSSRPAKITVYYDISQYLENTVVDTNFTTSRKMTLTKLLPDTQYFVRVRAVDASGVSYITPEFFVFKTPKESAITEEVGRRYYIGSSGVILDSAHYKSLKQPFVFPVNTVVDIVLPFEDKSPAQVYIKQVNTRVLGLNNFTKNTYHDRVRLLETQEGVYSGQFMTSKTEGLYDLMVEKRQIDGDFSIEKLTQIHAVNPMTIRNEQGRPIENARISVDIYNPKTKLYEDLPVESIGLTNPVKSNSSGTVPFILPSGRYLIQISSIGYKSLEESFEFAPDKGKYYPQFTMQKAPFSILDVFRYLFEIVTDLYQYINHYLDELYASYRFMHITTFAGIFLLSVLSLYLTAHYLTVRVEDIYIFIVKLCKKLTHPFVRQNKVFTSFVENQDGMPVHGVLVVMSPLNDPNAKGQKDLTNVFGEFELAISDASADHTLTLRKDGFVTKKITVTEAMFAENNHHIVLEEDAISEKGKMYRFIHAMLSGIVRTFADSLLLFVIVIHAMYIGRFGVLSDIPLLLITLVNVIIYFELLWKNYNRANGVVKQEQTSSL